MGTSDQSRQKGLRPRRLRDSIAIVCPHQLMEVACGNKLNCVHDRGAHGSVPSAYGGSRQAVDRLGTRPDSQIEPPADTALGVGIWTIGLRYGRSDVFTYRRNVATHPSLREAFLCIRDTTHHRHRMDFGDASVVFVKRIRGAS